MLNVEVSPRRPFNIQHSTFFAPKNMTTTQIETRERLTPGPASSAMLWEYSPSLEATDHARLQSRYNLFIGGKFVEPHSKRWCGRINPPTAGTLTGVAAAGGEDVYRAGTAARAAPCAGRATMG